MFSVQICHSYPFANIEKKLQRRKEQKYLVPRDVWENLPLIAVNLLLLLREKQKGLCPCSIWSI